VNIETRQFLTSLYGSAVAAADPARALRPFLPERPKGRLVVVGAGKGAAQLAAAFEDLWDGPLEGTVVTRYGYGQACRHIHVLEAAHPVPDVAGLAASDALFQQVAGLGPDDLVVALICGGGSALLPAPISGLSFNDEVLVNEVLLASGAPISAMNLIRKHVSRIKGGRLALAAYPARVVSLIVSDVPGDDPAQVASGPTVPDTGTASQALAAIRQYRMQMPDNILNAIATSQAPSPDAPEFARNQVHVISSATRSLEAAAGMARATGINAVILSDAIEGEAREVGRVHAAIAREVQRNDRPFQKPVLILSGGETTVTLDQSGGRGGRNSEFLLAFALAIDGLEGISALAADTDGIDGSQDNAGAFADGSTAQAIRAAGFDPTELLTRHDAWGAFEAANSLFVTGPTGTNVNDFRAILIR
jgi:glycerate 2-kinase